MWTIQLDPPAIAPDRVMLERPVEVLVKPSRGDFETTTDSRAGRIHLQVVYRPALLAQPAVMERGPKRGLVTPILLKFDPGPRAIRNGQN